MPEQKYLASLTTFGDIFVWFGPLVGTLALITFVVVRTRSLFFLLHRIQSLLGGAQSFHDERVQRHWKSFEDMHRLNLWFGLKLNSSRAMHQLFAWLDRHNIGVGEIAKAVPFFDTNKLEFSFPATWRIRLEWIWVSVASLFLLVNAATFAASNYALFYVKKTHTGFWVNAGHAYSADYPLRSLFAGEGSWHLEGEYCLFTDEAAPLDNDWDKAVICHLILGERDDYIKETIESQRYLVVFLICVLLIVAVPSLLRAKSRKQAHVVQERVAMSDQHRLNRTGAARIT